jgi:hypothetical protein
MRCTLEEFAPLLREDESSLTYWWGAGLPRYDEVAQPSALLACDWAACGARKIMATHNKELAASQARVDVAG